MGWRRTIYFLFTFTAAFLLAAAAFFYAFAFDQPSSAPPGGNVDVPVVAEEGGGKSGQIAFPGVTVGAGPASVVALMFENDLPLGSRNTLQDEDNPVDFVLTGRTQSDETALYLRGDFTVMGNTNAPVVRFSPSGEIFAGAFCIGTSAPDCVSNWDGGWIRSGDNIYASVSGYIGIGTQTPLSPLHIAGRGGQWTNSPADASNSRWGKAIDIQVDGGAISWAPNSYGVSHAIYQDIGGLHFSRKVCPNCSMTDDITVQNDGGVEIYGGLDAGKFWIDDKPPITVRDFVGRDGIADAYVWYDTGFSTLTHSCFAGDIAYVDGDIQENDVGNIMVFGCYDVAGTWKCGGGFRSHKNHEEVRVVGVCLDSKFADDYRS